MGHPSQEGAAGWMADTAWVCLHIHDALSLSYLPRSLLTVFCTLCAQSKDATEAEAYKLIKLMTDPCLTYVLQGTEGLVLDPVLGLELTSRCMVHFLQQRLPLTAEQRSMIEVAATPKPSTGRQPSQSLHKQASSTPTGPAPSVRDVSQRQQPRPIAQNDRAAFENITKGHLFKIQLAT